MDQIAFILGETYLYWSSILMALAAASAVLLFLGLYLDGKGKVLAAACVIPLAVALSLYLARLLHWYCLSGSYSGLRSAVTDLPHGGYALAGAFAGCFLAAGILRILRIVPDLGEMLDCMSVAGAAGIAVGRTASFASAADRGQILARLRGLPWESPVVNPVSGMMEHRLATFVLQAAVAAVLFAALLLFLGNRRRKKTVRSGDTALLFLLVYGASQVILDSTRYDSLYFRSNGFVSMVQVLGALGFGMVLVVFSVRLVRARGFKAWYLGLWGLMAALTALAGYMEYHVQRHSDQAVLAYSVMSACLSVVVILGIGIWKAADTARLENAYSARKRRGT